jgi:nucleotide-binding universal stress UspA family protein
MLYPFKKIGIAIAFSPTAKALLAEAAKWATQYRCELVIVHVGHQGSEEDIKMKQLIDSVSLFDISLSILWRNGEPVEEILKVCESEKIDLLVAGALKKENLLQNYIGTVARKIMRKADCSILMIQNPNSERKPIKNIVVNAEDSPFVQEAIETACYIGETEYAQWIHIVRELKLLGLTLSASEQRTESEYLESKQGMVREEMEQVEKILLGIPHSKLKINIKVLSGKSGFELARFAERKNAELLIVGAPIRRFSLFDRIFPHDLEYVFANLPCNLLVVNPRKKTSHG